MFAGFLKPDLRFGTAAKGAEFLSFGTVSFDPRVPFTPAPRPLTRSPRFLL
jgi:hypothetical protein